MSLEKLFPPKAVEFIVSALYVQLTLSGLVCIGILDNVPDADAWGAHLMGLLEYANGFWAIDLEAFQAFFLSQAWVGLCMGLAFLLACCVGLFAYWTHRGRWWGRLALLVVPFFDLAFKCLMLFVCDSSEILWLASFGVVAFGFFAAVGLFMEPCASWFKAVRGRALDVQDAVDLLHEAQVAEHRAETDTFIDTTPTPILWAFFFLAAGCALNASIAVVFIFALAIGVPLKILMLLGAAAVYGPCMWLIRKVEHGRIWARNVLLVCVLLGAWKLLIALSTDDAKVLTIIGGIKFFELLGILTFFRAASLEWLSQKRSEHTEKASAEAGN